MGAYLLELGLDRADADVTEARAAEVYLLTAAMDLK
jgi:hypothetical protein